jgi:predicted GTPase
MIRYGAEEIVDPRPYAQGTISETYAKYPTIGVVLPAMGYGNEQMEELEKTINSADAEMVVIGTPIDLGKLLNLDKPYQNVRYDLEEIGQPRLPKILETKFGRGSEYE